MQWRETFSNTNKTKIEWQINRNTDTNGRIQWGGVKGAAEYAPADTYMEVIKRILL